MTASKLRTGLVDSSSKINPDFPIPLEIPAQPICRNSCCMKFLSLGCSARTGAGFTYRPIDDAVETFEHMYTCIFCLPITQLKGED